MSQASFSYSNEQGNNIIVSESLREDTDTPPPEEDLNGAFYDLRKLMERDLKLHWHIVFLSDHWRDGLIPRGLRIAKFPSFPTDDEEFKTTWESILNKCSRDLMLLLIKQAKSERTAVNERIQTLRASMAPANDAQIPYEEKLKTDLEKLETNIKQAKMRKLKRDEDDYKRKTISLFFGGRMATTEARITPTTAIRKTRRGRRKKRKDKKAEGNCNGESGPETPNTDEVSTLLVEQRHFSRFKTSSVSKIVMAMLNVSKYKEIISKSTLVHPGCLKVYQVYPKETKIGNFTRMTFGEKNVRQTNRTILLVGETGTGKSTLINALVNYTMGVTWKDEVWFQVVKEEGKRQTESHTSDVVVYEVFGFEGQLLPFSLTLIDTPGYGATKGTKDDHIVTARLYDLFRSVDGVREIHAVGLLVKASENRLSERQEYILNSVMSLFGKNMEKNLVSLITHSDGNTPKNAFETLERAGVKCGKNEKNQPIHFLFDNCQEIKGEQKERALRYAYETSTEGMKGLKTFLENIKPQYVEKSMNVLAERIRLTACIQNLQERIQNITMKQTEIKRAQEDVKKCKEEGRDMVDITETHTVEESIKGGWWFLVAFYSGATRCTHCKENCHYPGCTYAPSAATCEVIKGGKCTSCTNKCPASVHVKDDKMYETKTRQVKKSLFDAEEKYGLLKCKKELEDLKADKKRWLDEAYQHVVKLDDIALITNSLSTHVHLDGLIKGMMEEGDEGKTKKLKEFQKRLDRGLQAALKYKLMGE
ncbi:uncharacterized protein LOC134446518 [Engraulis encrasicolus]|uniref:uncharacterized protein LOC134446518 n=1 Tax=Engraulis encrasicolus TaxID=184585 RepID=UPI002FD63C2F